MLSTIRMLAFAATIGVFAGSASAAVLSGPITNPANGHVYYLLDQDTWTNSQAEAITLGGNLVTINNADENQWVFDTFASFDNVDRNLWIGLNDAVVEGTFVWASGEPLSYSNWATGQPSNSLYTTGPEPDEDYVNVVGPSGYSSLTPSQWNDGRSDPAFFADVTGPVHGVVEVVPEPATLGLLMVSGIYLAGRRRG